MTLRDEREERARCSFGPEPRLDPPDPEFRDVVDDVLATAERCRCGRWFMPFAGRTKCRVCTGEKR